VVVPFFHIHEVPILAVSETLLPWQNVVAPPAAIVAVGNAVTVTVVAADVAVQPLILVTCTVYEPAVVVVYIKPVPTCVVPFFHI
jgi:hypothetical protein